MNEIENGDERDLRRDFTTPDVAIKAAQVDGNPHLAHSFEEKFVSDLDARMAKSKLAELGWRDREGINDVMRDLEFLAGKDWHQAAKLWDKYRPGDIDKPIFIDGDDIDEKKPEHASASLDTQPSEQTSRRAKARNKGKDDEFVIPASVLKRYRQVGDKFYFQSKSQVAFEDKGARLKTEHNDPDIARSMVELAEAKGWTSLKVKGTDEFKSEVWLQASLREMEVTGYKATSVDLARLALYYKLQERAADLDLNTIESMNTITKAPERAQERDQRESPAKGPKPEKAPINSEARIKAAAVEKVAVVDEHQRTLSRQQGAAIEAIKKALRDRGDSQAVVDMAADIAAERFQNNRVYVGKVLEHGWAPYEHVPNNEKSHFVRLQTDAGEKVVWGVDLPRAIQEGRVQIGDEVALAYQGRQKVTVPVLKRDEHGKAIGEDQMLVDRNAWDMRKFETLREEVKERVKVAARNANVQPVLKVYDRNAPSTEVRPEFVREPNRENERARG